MHKTSLKHAKTFKISYQKSFLKITPAKDLTGGMPHGSSQDHGLPVGPKDNKLQDKTIVVHPSLGAQALPDVQALRLFWGRTCRPGPGHHG